jgi:tRNA (cmo5U34)-methyltransferase
MKDEFFAKEAPCEKFEFNAEVAKVFDDMLERSIPLYRECRDLAIQFCMRYAQPQSRIYDLGCSAGSFLEHLTDRLGDSFPAEIIGVDNSAPMLERARKRLKGRSVRLEEGDLVDACFEVKLASVVILNYTLQFVPPSSRLALLRKIHSGLLEHGRLILIEKIKGEHPESDEVFIDFYHEFKRRMGYSELEISRKRDALEEVLIARTLTENIDLLREAGFSRTEIFFKWNNFAGLIALK